MRVKCGPGHIQHVFHLPGVTRRMFDHAEVVMNRLSVRNQLSRGRVAPRNSPATGPVVATPDRNNRERELICFNGAAAKLAVGNCIERAMPSFAIAT